jgi:hypothetical protein
MPAFVIVAPGKQSAVLCDASSRSGAPDRRTDTPVVIRSATEQLLYLDDEPKPRLVLSSTGWNGTTTLLVSGSTRHIRNRQKRVALARAAALLDDLAAVVRPFVTTSRVHADLAASGLQMLFDWTRLEREDLAAAPHDGDRRDERA